MGLELLSGGYNSDSNYCPGGIDGIGTVVWGV